MNSKSLTSLAAALTLAGLLAGCVTPAKNPNTSNALGNTVGAEANDPCAVGTSALTGALAGALLGGLTGGKSGLGKGAVLGGAAGAILCVGINVQSRQTRSAAQAATDYQKSRGALPPEPVVVTYTPQLAEITRRGHPVRLASSVELVNGTAQSVNEVREELQVTDTEGKPFKSGSKSFSTQSAGRFENTFELKLPDSASQGSYGLQTRLFVNGKLAATRDLKTQLVLNEQHQLVVAALP